MLMKKVQIKFILDIHRVLNEKYKLKQEIIDEFSIDIKAIDERNISKTDWIMNKCT